VTVTLDYSGLYGVQESTSLFDDRLIEPELLTHLAVEPEMLDATRRGQTVEPWLRRALLTRLGEAGAVIHTTPIVEGIRPSDTARPTATLRHVGFALQNDAFPVVVVDEGEGRLSVRHGALPDDVAACPRLKLKLDYIQLYGTLQRASDDAVVALFNELVVVPMGGEATAQITIEEGRLCEAVAATFERDAFRPRDDQVQLAARQALDAALLPFGRAAAAGPKSP